MRFGFRASGPKCTAEFFSFKILSHLPNTFFSKANNSNKSWWRHEVQLSWIFCKSITSREANCGFLCHCITHKLTTKAD